MSTTRHYGTLYLVAPGHVLDSDRRQEDVVEAFQYARSHIDVAKELWSLAGEDSHVHAIDEIVDRAYERESRILSGQDIDELLAQFTGLDDALKRTVIDEEMRIRPERMAEVRKHAQLVDVDEARGDLAFRAIWEALTRVWALRNILTEARQRGLDVAVD